MPGNGDDHGPFGHDSDRQSPRGADSRDVQDRRSFPTLDALREGYEVYPVVDAVGGTSVEAHRAALERIVQAGAQPTSWVQLLYELQRDWSRKETAQPFAEIV